MAARVFDGTTAPSDSNAYQRIENVGVDASVNSGGGGSIDKPDAVRGKLSYVYQARTWGTWRSTYRE